MFQLMNYRRYLLNIVSVKQVKLYTTGEGVDVSQIIKKNCEEIKIPVPWGYVASKWWGPQNNRPLICIHGWQDNSGTFDTLAPMLPDHLGLLTIDYPGHGLSPPHPRGIFYHGIDTPILIRRIQRYFGWSHVSLMGHSMGGNAAFTFSSLYPSEVDMLIQLDALKPYSAEPGGYIAATRRNILKFLRYDALSGGDSEPPSYPRSELAERLHIGTRQSIDVDKCEYILERGIAKSSKKTDGWYYTRDSRLKLGLVLGDQHTDLREYAARVKCPMLVIRASEGTNLDPEHYLDDIVTLCRNTNERFKRVKIEGTHHLHLNEPEKIAPIIKDFLFKYDTGSRKTSGIPFGLESQKAIV